jgi:hypothetical protein
MAVLKAGLDVMVSERALIILESVALSFAQKGTKPQI